MKYSRPTGRARTLSEGFAADTDDGDMTDISLAMPRNKAQCITVTQIIHHNKFYNEEVFGKKYKRVRVDSVIRVNYTLDRKLKTGLSLPSSDVISPDVLSSLQWLTAGSPQVLDRTILNLLFSSLSIPCYKREAVYHDIWRLIHVATHQVIVNRPSVVKRLHVPMIFLS